MPGAAHVFIAVAVGLMLYKVSNKKFTPFHVFLFAFLSTFGPDIGWVIPPRELSDFIHTVFGYSLFAIPYSIPFYALVKKNGEPTTFNHVYRINLAGGLAHIGVDGIGHIIGSGTLQSDNFWLFSFVYIDEFFVNPVGLVLFITANACFCISVLRFYHKLATGQQLGRKASVMKILDGVLPFFVILATILPLPALPFGDGKWFSIGEAVYNTSELSGTGSSTLAYLMIVICLGFAVCFVIISRHKRNDWRTIFLALFMLGLFASIMAYPALGGGEGDAGTMYALLLFVALPGWLLSTSYYDKIVLDLASTTKPTSSSTDTIDFSSR
jgi:hypothetical protein